jgi:hypothetical protein
MKVTDFDDVSILLCTKYLYDKVWFQLYVKFVFQLYVKFDFSFM